MNTQINGRTFGLKGERACISGLKNKEKYMAYQNSYRETYGVYPELDRINNPYTARFDDVYTLCCALRKTGVDGAFLFHDLHARYRKKLRYIYEHYSREWAFLLSVDLERRTTLVDIPKMAPVENIVNGLGYRKEANGNYYEGTWQGDRLIYGFVYLAKQGIFYTGSFDESGVSDCCGVMIDLGATDKKGRRCVNTTAGTFRMKNGELSLYDSICLINLANIKHEELVSLDSYVGCYEEGYAEGTFINKEISNDIRIRWDKYRDGEIKSSISSVEMIPRIIMTLYMFMWYIIKYTYGSMLLVLPLYYHFRKKNWKI